MLEAATGSLVFPVLTYFLWIAALTARQRRNTYMRDAFFTPPTRREVEAAKRWLRQELRAGA